MAKVELELEHSEDSELLGMVDEGSFGSTDDKSLLAQRTYAIHSGEDEDSMYFRDMSEGAVTYRFVQVEDNTRVVDPAAASGEFLVIGNPPGVYSTHPGEKALGPRDVGVTKTIKKRDDKRRATHNEVERRRRDKINSWITKLAALVPNTAGQPTDAQSKGGILAKACDYITELTQAQNKHQECLRDNERLVVEVIKLNKGLAELRRENAQLKSQLNDKNNQRSSTAKS